MIAIRRPALHLSRRKLILGASAAAGGLLLSQRAALAAIGTPILIGNQENSPTTITTSVDAPAGSLIVVAVGCWDNQNSTIISVTDSALNTYDIAVQATAPSVSAPCGIAYCLNSTNDLPSGGTITITQSGLVQAILGAWIVSGANGGLDAAPAGVTPGAGASSVSISTGTLAQANEIVFGFVTTSQSISVLSNPSGFTELWNNTATPPGPIDNTMAFSYNIVSSTSTVTYNPSWTSAVNVASVMASFKATAGAARPLAGSLITLGVGQ
jgi:hypothetical protein